MLILKRKVPKPAVKGSAAPVGFAQSNATDGVGSVQQFSHVGAGSVPTMLPLIVLM